MSTPPADSPFPGTPAPASMSPAPDRRTALLDAALRVIGTGGLQALTHRAVQQEAGAPHGSVTYYFKSREQLIVAIVQRLAEVDRERMGELGHALAMAFAAGPGSVDVERLAELIGAWIDQDPITQVARYELLLASVHDAHVRTTMSAGTAMFWRQLEPIALAAGSEDPARDARIMVAMLDGLLLDRLAREPADPSVLAEGLRQLLTPRR